MNFKHKIAMENYQGQAHSKSKLFEGQNMWKL